MTCLVRAVRCSSVWAIHSSSLSGSEPPRTAYAGSVRAVAIAADGTWLASGNDGTVRTWNADGTPRAAFSGHDGWVIAMAISPDGTWLAAGSDDGTVRIWNAEGIPQPAAIRVDGLIQGCAWSSEGSDFYVAGETGLYKFALRAPDG